MVRHFVWIHRAYICDLEDIDQKFGEFKCARGNLHGQLVFCCSRLEEPRVVMLDHTHARTGWTDDRSVAFGKGAHEIQRDRACLLFESIIEEGLSAAGLFRREGQCHAKPLQDVGHMLKCPRMELITETGDEELRFVGHESASRKVLWDIEQKAPGGIGKDAAHQPDVKKAAVENGHQDQRDPPPQRRAQLDWQQDRVDI